MADCTEFSLAKAASERRHATVMDELRRLLPKPAGFRPPLPLGLAALDSHLPEGGLLRALHEIVPQAEIDRAAALGFGVALLGRMAHVSSPQSGKDVIFVLPAYERREFGRLHGHGLNALGLDPARAVLVETAHRKDTLWALAEALRSGAPQAVVGVIDQLDLKTSQKLHLAAVDCGLPLFLLRPAQSLESSAAATRWRIRAAKAARDRFGLFTQVRWQVRLERCRNGRPGAWMVEYDHVAHRFSLAAALADPALSRGAGESRQSFATAHCA